MIHKLTFEYDGQIPVGFLLTSYPENLIKLQNHNESFSRLFYHFNVESLKDEDVEYFFKEKFTKENISYSDEIIQLLVNYSYGIPLVMQEIGDNIYWLCDDSKEVNLNIALKGIKKASQTIHDRYLNSIISDENYVKILEIIKDNVDSTDLTSFDTKVIKKNLNDDEKVILNAFIKESLENEIITMTSHYEKNKFKFNNPLYVVYLKIQSI